MELLESINKNLEKVDGISKEAKEAKAEVEKIKTDFAAEVKKVTDENIAKGATIKQLEDDVKELKAKGGRVQFSKGTSNYLAKNEIIKSNIASMIEEKKDNFFNLEKGRGFETLDVKAVAVMNSGNLSSDNYHTYLPYQPGMRPLGQTRFRDLVSVYQSALDTIQYPQQDTPPGEGSFGYQANEGDAKSQLDYNITMKDLTLKAMAGYAITSRQSLRNIPFLQSFLPQNLMEDLLDQEDLIFGQVVTAGATGSSTITGTNTYSVEKIVRYVSNLKKKKYFPNAIVIDPAVYDDLILTRPDNFSLPNIVTIDANGNVRILGIVVSPVNWLASGAVLVGDFSRVGIVESESLSLRQSDSHASTFIANQITFLLERTEGVALFRPDGFIYTILS